MLISDPSTESLLNRNFLQETIMSLKSLSTKLTSRRLHLQALIAKRDRIDYEILHLKKRIQEDKKARTIRGQRPIKEQANFLLETYRQRENFNLVQPFNLQELQEVNLYIDAVEKEIEYIKTLEELPRLEESV